MNLLIVDDEMIAVKGMLDGVDWKSCGIDGSIWTAYSAEWALKILNVQQVDLMLCDIELLRAIREIDRELPCIFLTCHASFEYAQEAISLQCTDYILKPAPYEVIAEKVKKACEDIRKRRKEKVQEKYFAETGQEPPQQQRNAKTPAELVALIEQYIEKYLKESSLLVTDIAEALYLNKDYLNRVFKKEKGVSISQYLISERMKLAAVLLREEGSNVNLVAEKVGYNNYPYFASSFKRFYGCTPSQYQREQG